MLSRQNIKNLAPSDWLQSTRCDLPPLYKQIEFFRILR